MHSAQVFVVPFPVKYTVCRIIIAHSFAVMVAQPPKTFKDLKKLDKRTGSLYYKNQLALTNFRERPAYTVFRCFFADTS